MSILAIRFVLLLLAFLPCCLAAESVHEQLVRLAAANKGNIPLDEATFDLLTSSQRTWSASVQLTAMDNRFRCAPCKSFSPSFQAVAKSWSTVPEAVRHDHFFGTVDYDKAPEIFRKFGLNSAPMVYIFPPANGPRRPANGKLEPLKYDFSNGFQAGPLAEHLSNHTPIPIPYKLPVDWVRISVNVTTILGFLASLWIMAPIYQNRWFWALLTILTSQVMTSGFMYTQIRGVPYNSGGKWIAGGFQNQFGQEVPVVAAVYTLAGLPFLVLILAIPKRSAQTQGLQTCIWLGIQMTVFSILLSMFKIKNGSYPFSFLS